MLAGMVAPAEATWAALRVLYTACLPYGVPEHLGSDGGGASTSKAFEAVCPRLAIDHRTSTSGAGESGKHLMETHLNIHRRLYDDQFSLAKTLMACEPRHHAFIQRYTTTAHQGLLREGFHLPIPHHGLGEAQGRLSAAEDWHRKFVHHLFRRTTNRHGGVALPHYHFHVDEGLPQQPVLVWRSGDRLRVACERVVVAEYRGHDAWRVRKILDIGSPVFYQTRFASAPGNLRPGSEPRWLGLYRPRQARRREPRARAAPQLP
jgi:hypothetical protein